MRYQDPLVPRIPHKESQFIFLGYLPRFRRKQIFNSDTDFLSKEVEKVSAPWLRKALGFSWRNPRTWFIRKNMFISRSRELVRVHRLRQSRLK